MKPYSRDLLMANTEQKSILQLECFHYIVADITTVNMIYSHLIGSSPTACSNWNLFSVFWEVDFLAALKITKNTSEIEIWSRKVHSRISDSRTSEFWCRWFPGGLDFFRGILDLFRFWVEIRCWFSFFIFFQNRKSPVLGVTSLYAPADSGTTATLLLFMYYVSYTISVNYILC